MLLQVRLEDLADPNTSASPPDLPTSEIDLEIDLPPPDTLPLQPAALSSSNATASQDKVVVCMATGRKALLGSLTAQQQAQVVCFYGFPYKMLSPLHFDTSRVLKRLLFKCLSWKHSSVCQNCSKTDISLSLHRGTLSSTS